ncbi:MAG: response regulator, partial [Chloroflexota bacterium]
FGKGSGLGLSSVDGFIAQSGGFVSVESELGVGSTFSVHLPRTGDAPATAVDREAAHPATARPATLVSRETILLVEDEPAVRTVTARQLRDIGYAVLEAGDPAAALAIAESGAGFDLLLTDLVMPGMNGRVLSERLTDRRPGLPVLFISGYAFETVFGDGLVDQAARFLAKPFDRETLAARVRELLDGRPAVSP